MERDLRLQRIQILQEKQRRASLPINTYVPDSTPDRNQLLFHSSPARYRLALGGNRAGKSVVTAYEVAATARNCHRFRELEPGPKTIYVVSAEYRTLYQGIYRHLMPDESGMKFLDPKWIVKKGPTVPGATVPLPSYVKVRCQSTPKGVIAEDNETFESTIWFISGDGGEQARRKMQAVALDLVVIDEEVPESVFTELNMRLLDHDGDLAVSATLVRSEDWLMNLEDRANEGDETTCLVRLSTASSKHLPENAKKEIFSGLTPEEYAVRVEGKSRRSFGLAYPTFNEHHVVEVNKLFPRGFPEEFKLYSCNDPGWRTHAVLYAAVDEGMHEIYFYRELYLREMPLHEVAKAMAEAEGYDLVSAGNGYSVRQPKANPVRPPEQFEVRLIDPAAFRKSDAGQMGVAEQLAAFYDTPCGPANNDIHSGLQAGNRLLDINPNTGRPHALFDINLSNFFKERRKYRYRKDTSSPNMHETKQEPVKKEDHLMDAFRYLSIFILSSFTGVDPHNRRADGQNYNVTTQKSAKMAERLEAHAHRLRTGTNSYVGGII